MNKDELKKILKEHKLWRDRRGGQKADLRAWNLSHSDLRGLDFTDVDISGAYLVGADLRGANLDYSCWPLCCGSKKVKVGLKLARQIAAHFCVLDCNAKEYKAAKKAILKFAQKSHRAKDLGLLEVK